MKKRKKNRVGVNDANFIIEKLRAEVFAVPLLKQEHILKYFHEIDTLMSAVMRHLLSNSSIIRQHIYNTILKVASGNTYGRNIYEKGNVDKVELEKERLLKPILKKMEKKFLERSFDFMWLCSSGSISRLQDSFAKADFIRGIYEECIDIFIESTQDYKKLNIEASALLIKIRKTYNMRIMEDYDKVLQKIRKIENNIQIENYTLFGLISFVEDSVTKIAKLKTEIINPYLRIVYSISKNLSKNNDQLLDNFQNGTLGLLKAISCYSVKRESTFSAAAKWWIRQMILLTIKEDANFVKLPISTWQAYTILEKARVKLEAQGKDTEENLAALTKMPLAKVRNIYESVKVSQVYSLNRTFDDEEKLNLTSVLTDAKTLLADTNREAVMEIVLENLQKLPKDILISIALNFGMVDILPQTLLPEDKAVKLEAIRQLCHKNKILFKPFEITKCHLKIISLEDKKQATA